MATDEAIDAVQASTTGFTGHELAYLLSLNPSEAARQTAELFHLGDGWSEDQVVAIGASSLLARGLLESSDGTTLEPVDAASWVGALGTLAIRGTEFGVVTNDFTEGSLLLEADGSRALVQPRALGTWWFTPVAEAASRGDLFAVVIDAIAELGGPIGITARSTSGGSSETFTARRVDGEWGFAIGVTGAAEPSQTADGVEAGAVSAALKGWLDGIGA